MSALAVLLVHAAATWCLVGLIWTIQLVHYPLFAGVGAAGFGAYHAAHSRRITWLVGPLMLTEALCALWLVGRPPEGVPAWSAWLGLALVGAVWLSTAFVQVPLHARLARSFEDEAGRALVRSNWWRTALWTARGVLALVMVAWAVG